MVLLIQASQVGQVSNHIFTFHYGSTYTNIRFRYSMCLNLIYIPLWFYLYWQLREIFFHLIIFTFHYGSTYTLSILTNTIITIPFTFHYGSTYTDRFQMQYNNSMVFTFHYGSTYTGRPGEVHHVDAIFTFHYGSTYTIIRFYLTVNLFYLHSTMVLLIHVLWMFAPVSYANLHSTMVLLIL